MLFEHRYAGSSAVRGDAAATAMAFQPDTLREPTYFRGRITRQLEFREAISALHDVVTSDLRFIPKDRTAYLAWRAQQSYVDLAKVTSDQQKISAEITALQTELSRLDAAAANRRSGFYKARQKYFDYIYTRDKELWFKLDPVITVHPDQVFFECFSRDESSYGRLAASYDVFDDLGERACGTTNIDYSEKLYGEFQKIRSYKTTTLDIDPGGFDVSTSLEETYREVKIDLPDSWVRGFLQVSAAATLPANVVELHPMDVHNLCLVLRRNKELIGPRSLRFRLAPGGPVSIAVEPWNTIVECPRSRMTDGHAGEIRVWGRRRLFILERLLPLARRVRVFLLGSGLPTFWVVDLGPPGGHSGLGALSFTLGLSGWTHNNWSEAGNFDLMAAREDVDSVTQDRVFAELGTTWLATPDELAARTGLQAPIVASALAGWVQCGRAIYDLDRGVYRKRELTRTPLPVEQLRYANPREQAAAALLHRAKIAVDRADAIDGSLALAGRVHEIGPRGKLYAPTLTFDADRRLVHGECTCDFFIRNRLHKGPCEHMLALRAAHRRGINDTIALPAARPGAPAPAGTPQGSFQLAFRKAVTRAAELRAGGRLADSIAELEKIARLAPPGSAELGRLSEVIAESRLEGGDHAAARQAAERALAMFPTSPLALRVKRDALAALDEVPAAIAAARALAQAEDTPLRWDELCKLCRRADDMPAMLGFAMEGLRRHKDHPVLVAHRDAAAAAGGGVPASPQQADKPSWWRRAVGALTGKPPTQPPAVLDVRVDRILGELSAKAVIGDRDAVAALVRAAHAAADRDEARVFAIAAALKDTPFVTGLPDDQELLALLRRALA